MSWLTTETTLHHGLPKPSISASGSKLKIKLETDQWILRNIAAFRSFQGMRVCKFCPFGVPSNGSMGPSYLLGRVLPQIHADKAQRSWSKDHHNLRHKILIADCQVALAQLE